MNSLFQDNNYDNLFSSKEVEDSTVIDNTQVELPSGPKLKKPADMIRFGWNSSANPKEDGVTFGDRMKQRNLLPHQPRLPGPGYKTPTQRERLAVQEMREFKRMYESEIMRHFNDLKLHNKRASPQ